MRITEDVLRHLLCTYIDVRDLPSVHAVNRSFYRASEPKVRAAKVIARFVNGRWRAKPSLPIERLSKKNAIRVYLRTYSDDQVRRTLTFPCHAKMRILTTDKDRMRTIMTFKRNDGTRRHMRKLLEFMTLDEICVLGY